jgi:hypothetical protein
VTALADARWKGWRHRRAAALAALVVFLTGAVAVAVWHWPWTAGQLRPDGQPADPQGSLDLLAKPPGERLPPRGFNARLEHDPKKRHLRFESSSNHALIPLGTTDARGYRLLVGFHQPQWVGDFGVYFGGREEPAAEIFHFQLIALRKTGQNDGRRFQLTRATGTVRQVRGEPRVQIHTFAPCVLPRPLDNSEQLLVLEVKPRGLVRVSWNGEPCEELVTDAATESAKDVGHQGEFGIYCVGSSGTVMTARYWTTE